MDRATLSDAIIDELGQLLAASLRQNAAELLASDLDGIEQRLQEMMRGVLGRVVEEIVVAISTAHSTGRPNCPGCERPMRPVDYARPRNLQGLVGDYRIVRAYFYCAHCKLGLSPLDEHLGLGAGALSAGLERVACRLGIEESFEDAADVLHETLKVDVAPEAIRRVTEGIGQVVEGEAQAQVERAKAGAEPLGKEAVKAASEVLLVEVDGVMVHEVDGEWHEVKSGLAASLGPKTRQEEKTGRVSLAMGEASYCAGFEGAEAFWWRVYVEAYRRGLGSRLVSMVVVLGDGAEWIWRRVPGFLGVGEVRVVEIVDIYHAWEHLGKVAVAVFGQGSEKAKEWAEPLKEELEEKGVGPILAALGELKPGSEEAAEEVRKAIGYFTEHAGRMDYPRFVGMKLPIGSGAIESTCKTLIEAREKGAGMRWTEVGAQQVASLRALHRSGRWDELWKAHPQMHRPAVFPRRQAKPTKKAA